MDELYTIREVANRVHKCEQSVIRWLKDGKLPCTQVSERRRLISEADLQEFLDSRKISPPKKRMDIVGAIIPCSSERSLTTSGERKAEMSVKSLRKEISQLCQQ